MTESKSTFYSESSDGFIMDHLKGALQGMVGAESEGGIPFGGSFARRSADNSAAHWFVDGRGMMEHAANMMECAREEIFITDWWLSPQVHLKRPNLVGNHWRLDYLLKRKAEEGVKVFVMLYKEVEMALGLKSLATKRHLQALHPNVMVIRHPEHLSLTNSTVWWSHHEKLIIVDQNVAFIGGLDLAYGRWDDPAHRLTDVGSVRVSKSHYLNASDKNLVSAMKHMAVGMPGLAMPGTADDGSDAEDEGPPPSQSKWTNLKVTVATGMHKDSASSKRGRARSSERCRRKSRSRSGGRLSDDEAEQPPTEPGDLHRAKDIIAAKLDRMQDHIPQISQGFKRWRRHKVAKKSSQAMEDDREMEAKLGRMEAKFPVDQPSHGAKLWIGKDYINFIFKNFEDLHKPDEDFVDRAVTPRMPWHDVHLVLYGDGARDLARHFVTRWNAAKEEKTKLITYPHLLPKVTRWRVPEFLRRRSSPVQVQILRSISSWTLPKVGLTEASIHQAYLHLIAKAQHFVYIENQFFVSICDSPGGELPQNKVASALADRIVRAHEAGETFRVYAVIPLLPNFQGELGKRSGSALQPILHLTYASICRGRHSLFETLRRRGVYDPSQYIIFCGLRGWGRLGSRAVTELIYIHSKLMIVDDRYAIIGSANINDRSLLGNRDTEMAAYVEDTELTQVRLNGKTAMVGKLCRAFRLAIFKEHMGLLPEQQVAGQKSLLPTDVSDPVRAEFWDKWRALATANTSIYERLFHCLPSDQVACFEDIEAFNTQISLADYSGVAQERVMEELHRIQGHLVLYPLGFLRDSDLAPSITSKEGMVPPIVFT